MTSGFPAVVSKIFFLTQSAACSLDARAPSALSNTLIAMSTSGATIHQIVTPEPWHVSHNRHKAFLDTTCQLFNCALFHRVSSNAAEHGPILRQPIDPISITAQGLCGRSADGPARYSQQL